MCGIAGVIASRALPAAGWLESMSRLMRHRGPDDEGYLLLPAEGGVRLCSGRDTAQPDQAVPPWWPNGTVGERAAQPIRLGLMHRRLSIVDTRPAGHQPMGSTESGLWLVFNGEIYNYRALRAELTRLGHVFITDTDTEVILAAYREWGKACFDRFVGMWALALLDVNANRLLLCRDRFGIKPLYYWRDGAGLLAFASEIKAFGAIPTWRARAHAQGVYDYLVWGLQDHAETTLFDGVYQLAPGHWLEIALDQPEEALPQAWYSLRPQPFSASFEQAAEQFRALFGETVGLHLHADVPVGSCLSGGLDSSSVVCSVWRALPEKARRTTFSACSEEPRFDERRYIEAVVEQTRAEAHYVYPDPEALFETLPQLLWHQDEPFGSTSIYAQWRVFELAGSRGVRVMLDGQGADEQLAGYHGFWAPYLFDLLRHGRVGRWYREVEAMRGNHGYSWPWVFKRMLSRCLPHRLDDYLRGRQGLTVEQPDWLDWQRLGAIPANPNRTFGARAESVQALSLAQLNGGNLQMLLHWEDRDSMAHSIEARVPFLDHRLVEFVLGLPDDMKIGHGTTKRVLRAAMADRLPAMIANRHDKLGFATAEEVWLRTCLAERFKRGLAQAIEQCGGILKPQAMTELEQMIRGERPYSPLPWRQLCLGAWVERFGVQLP